MRSRPIRGHVLLLCAALLSIPSPADAQKPALDSVLFMHCASGDAVQVANLLKKGANPNATRRGESLPYTSPLALVIRRSRGC